MSELTESLGFNLTYTLTCYVELFSNLLKGARTSVIESESENEDFFFSFRTLITSSTPYTHSNNGRKFF